MLKAIHSTVEISPDRGDADEEGMDKTNDVERHLFGGENLECVQVLALEGNA